MESTLKSAQTMLMMLKRPFITFSLLTSVALIFFTCSGDPKAILHITEQPLYPPESTGPYQYRIETDTIFPAYMAAVKSLTIRVPKTDTRKPMPTIIIEPGFFSVATDLEDVENSYASHGFLVVGVTNTSHFNLITTSLTAYKLALLQAVQYVVESNKNSSSRLFGLIDTNAIGISGHSMGGGGVILACDSLQFEYNRFIKAAIAMNPFGNCAGANIRMPIFLFSSDLDAVINPLMVGASSSTQAVYTSFQSIPSGTKKLFANYKDMDHNAITDVNIFLATSGNANVFLPTMVSWFKVYLTGDDSYRAYIDTTGAQFRALRVRFVAKGTLPDYYYNSD